MQTPVNFAVGVGSKVKMQCKVNAEKVNKLWTKGEELITNDNIKYHITDDILTINNIEMSDSGLYSCLVLKNTETNLRINYTLRVLESLPSEKTTTSNWKTTIGSKQSESINEDDYSEKSPCCYNYNIVYYCYF